MESVSMSRLVARASSSGQTSNSVSDLLSTLIPVGLIALVLISIFLVYRVRAKRVFLPRTYLGELNEHQKTPVPCPSTFGWIKDFWAIPDDYVLSHHSLDGYLYLRFWRTIIKITFVGCLITWPILLPVYGTAGGGQTQFSRISYANTSDSPARLYATAIVAFVFFGVTMYFIAKESVLYVHLRQKYLLTPNISSRMSSRTVLFTNVPYEYMNEKALRSVFPLVKWVWLATDTTMLNDLVEDRDKIAMKLEAAEVSLCKAGNDKRIKYEKKGRDVDSEDPLQWAEENKRPTHRLKPIIGTKVDTIDWCRSHLKETIPSVEREQSNHWNGKADYSSAVFIEFETVHAAEAAYRHLAANMPKSMVPRAIGVRPEEIVWKNLGMGETQRKTRHTVAILLVVVLILIWAPLSAFVGAISNIQALTDEVPFLSFIMKIPHAILGVVTGLLPAVLLAVLMALVPIVLRQLSKLAGAVTLKEIELDTQNWFFAFQLIIVFLITTFSSGASAVATQIVQEPSQAPMLLAGNLPKASNFYISYFVVYGIGSSSKTLLNGVALLMYMFAGRFLDKTPRKMYNRYTKLPNIAWGSTYPVFVNLAVIAIAYSCIAPLVLVFATIGFSLLFIAVRYNVIYAVDTLSLTQQGAGYRKALQQLFTGVYLAEFCLIGLFAISSAGSRIATGPLVLMIIFTVFTVLFNILLSRTVKLLRETLAQESRMREDRHANEDSDYEMSSYGKTNGHDDDLTMLEPTTVPRHGISAKPLGFLGRILAPKALPDFAGYLNQPVPRYPVEVQREAYLNPSITSPTPLLWIPHDDMGLSKREKESTSKVIGITDSGAWWSSDKGRLTTLWEGQDSKAEVEAAKEAPIYEKRILY